MDGDKSQVDFDPTLNPRVYASAAICVNAARRTINLLEDCTKLSSPLEGNVLRMSIHNALSACVTLFANILHHPLDPQVQSDLSPKYTKRSRAKSRNTENPNSEDDESEHEDYKVERHARSTTGSEYPGSPLSPVNSARTQVSPFPPAPFDYNSRITTRRIFLHLYSKLIIIQSTAHDPHQSPSYYDTNPQMQHHTNLPGLNISQINPSNYHINPHTPLYMPPPRIRYSIVPLTFFYTPSQPATDFYHSSPDQHQHQTITSHRTNPFSNPMRSSNANLQNSTSEAEEPLVHKMGVGSFQ
ncbi:hypothetical protein DID88_007028 [Monilinia fructigena]|uniref:Uncharacterized protein n=1 Tax=Monilinia fructigena TaxID=38457 RepID=A0A395J831_9HELO|nr:hypothetical protein DID88_007028 [Monilinia fructigena]